MSQQVNAEAGGPKIFCAKCTAATSEKTPGDISTLNGIGRTFYGSAEPCAECGSVVRTLWWTCIEVPIVPLGSYRYKTAVEAGMKARFWCRKLPGFHWPQVLVTWVVGLAIGAAVGCGIILYDHWKSGKH